MNLPSLISDNVVELLVTIIEFTHSRQQLLSTNINCMHKSGFVPKDLAVDEFSELLNASIVEHVRNGRLVLCDTDNIKFGHAGTFQLKPIIDTQAQELLRTDPDEYLELQIDKLSENSLNQKLAAELLRQKQLESGV